MAQQEPKCSKCGGLVAGGCDCLGRKVIREIIFKLPDPCRVCRGRQAHLCVRCRGSGLEPGV